MNKIGLLLMASIFLVQTLAQTGTTWNISGPTDFPTDISGQINGIGRCTQLKFDPSNPNKIYTTSASGGLWMSADNGLNWSNMGTDNFFAMQCASICIDHTSSNTLYLGSGDPNYYGGGNGVYKSTDGGANWNLATTGISTGLIIEILMDPTNNQNLVAATDNGIFKSTNAGASWTNVKNGGDFKAMLLKPASVSVMYAVTSSEMWRSTDFGSTWTQITNGVVIPGGDGQGMRLAVSAADPNVVYLGMIADEGTILKSTDGGLSFSTVYNNPAQSLVGYDASSSGQGDYNFGMTADPLDANTVFVVAHCVWKSTDGGVNWTQLTDWWANCHTDMHGIVFHPTTPNMVFDINDGGVFMSTDSGVNWDSRADGISVTEIYHAGQSKLQRDLVSIGTQDNGELYQSGTNWITNRGGDWGSRVQFDYNSPNQVYYYENGNTRTLTGSESSINLPFTASNDISLEFNKKLPTAAISAYQNIYVCNDITAATPAWQQIGTLSPAATISSLESSLADSSVVYAIGTNNRLYRCDNIFATSPTYANFATPSSSNVASSIATIASDINVVYITCGTRVYRSENKGQTFTNVSTGLPVGINIIKIYHDEFTTDESIYLGTAKGVYYKNNTMSSWQNISYNLPTIADIQDLMLYNPGNAGSLLRVSYWGRGVWELPMNISSPATVDFVADQTVVCPTVPIQFTDQSFSSGTISGWNWSFTGGTPATSTSQNPTVMYTSPGSYSVSLTVTDANGVATLTKTTYIQITTAQLAPLSEGFETTFLPSQWSLFDDGEDGVVWKQNTTVGGNGTSTQSVYFDNYNHDVGSNRDELRTNNYDMTEILNPTLSFDVAYARYGGGNSDSLYVFATTDCGVSFTELFHKGGVDLATVPDDQNEFIPTSSQWRAESIDISSYIDEPQVMFVFQNRGQYGNCIYLDNINVNGISTAKLEEMKNTPLMISIYPNPANDLLNVLITTQVNQNGMLTLTDLLGHKIVDYKLNLNAGKTIQTIDVSRLVKGIYIISLNDGNVIHTQKIIVE